ncbi:MAG: DNA-processing protein DprA [Patescibacteria group bacterium]
MLPPDLAYFNAFNAISGVGVVTLRTLKARFGTFEDAWRASDAALADVARDPRTRDALIAGRKTIDPERAADILAKNSIVIISEDNEAYPAPLKEIPNPPIALYVRGNPDAMNCPDRALAVVGTRRPTRYGLDAAQTFSADLASQGITIISGLAVGIDQAAHAAAINAKGITLAVLGSGSDDRSLFPQQNLGLARRIIEAGGAVISEYPPGTPAFRAHFPQRNRIISGISRGVLVVEARERSGALITARFALEQNREVFAVPHPIGAPTGAGPNALIQEGAKLTLSARDILTELGIASNPVTPKERAETTDIETRILALLDEQKTADEIIVASGLATSSVMSALTTLELKGLIANAGGNAFRQTA